MKKNLSIFILFLSSSALMAQNYTPLLDPISNTWHYTANWIPVRVAQSPAANCDYGQCIFGSSIYYTDGDTLINGIT